VLAAVLVGWVSVTSVPATAGCSPPQITVAGAPSTRAGVTVAYPSQMVTIKGAGWSSCAAAAAGCGSSTGLQPLHGIRIDIARARGRTSMSRPNTWKIGVRERRVGEFDASDDATFSVGSVPLPADPGFYVVVASGAGEARRRVIGWVKIL
jgi:hypothetical protein